MFFFFFQAEDGIRDVAVTGVQTCALPILKIVAPNMALRVIDRAIQAHGGAGVTEDFGLAAAWAHARTLRIADGPDEVHRESVARLELSRHDRPQTSGIGPQTTDSQV